MTLAELIAEVYIHTNRPDLVNQTASAVRSATLKMHQLSYFDRDLFETGIDFVTENFLQTLDYALLLPRWRAIKYIRKSDGTNIIGPSFKILTPDFVFDSYNVEKSDVAYLSGNVFNIRSSTNFRYAILGCYLYPDVTDAGYNSWIALTQPYAIVHEAARVIFKSIGLMEESAQQNALVAEQSQLLISSNTVAEGY